MLRSRRLLFIALATVLAIAVVVLPAVASSETSPTVVDHAFALHTFPMFVR